MKRCRVCGSQFSVRSLLITVVLAFTLQGSRSAMGQGALAPPGPPAPTMKTLAQIEPRTPITNLPYTISVPGSYYLVANLVAGATNGIVIAADRVTLDLMGFELLGGIGDGVSLSGTDIRTNIVVRNGTVRNWSGNGVNAANSFHSRFENLQVAGNSSTGMVAGGQSIVRNCNAMFNGGSGISVSVASIVVECTARGNGVHGILGPGGGVVVSHCTARNNGINGINVGNVATVSDCTSFGSGTNGIVVGFYSAVTHCSAAANGSHGIVGNGGSTITDCTSGANGQNGIEVSGSCRVVNNNCTENGADDGDGAGIHVTAEANRIEANNVTGNIRGIHVDGSGNLIIRNSASLNPPAGAVGSSNYVIAAGNSIGPTVTSATIGVSGSPHANYDF